MFHFVYNNIVQLFSTVHSATRQHHTLIKHYYRHTWFLILKSNFRSATYANMPLFRIWQYFLLFRTVPPAIFRSAGLAETPAPGRLYLPHHACSHLNNIRPQTIENALLGKKRYHLALS